MLQRPTLLAASQARPSYYQHALFWVRVGLSVCVRPKLLKLRTKIFHAQRLLYCHVVKRRRLPRCRWLCGSDHQVAEIRSSNPGPCGLLIYAG